MISPIRIFAFTSLLASVLFGGIIGCSEEEVTTPTTPEPEVNEYLVSLPSWDMFCPPLADNDTQEDPVIEWECATQVIESTTPCSITRTPEDIVTYDPGSEILYVGSLIQGKGYMGGLGSIQALPINQRAPIKISISFQMANNSRTIEHPSLTTVNAAIGDLVETAHNAGHVSGSSIFFEKKSSYSLEQTVIALGLSAKFMKGSVSAKLQWNSTSEEHTVSAYFIQKMFTVSMEIPQRPGDFFSSDFTKELLDEQISLGRIGADNLPVYVSNIVYGRMLTLTMTSTYSETQMKASLEASYNNIGGTVSGEHLEVLQNSTINLVAIGGDDDLVLGYLTSGHLGEFFKEDSPLTTAVPISYTLRNVGDNAIAKVSETTNYNMVQYGSISVATYNDEGEWKSAVQTIMSYQKWECNLQNIQKADEQGNFQSGSDGQWFLGKKITFNGANTGYQFNFWLKNMDGALPSVEPIALVFNDQEMPIDNVISIGDVDNYDDDDFEIRVSENIKVYAIAFIMVDNYDTAGEYLQVFAKDKNGQECEITNYTTGIEEGFFGIVSPVPVTKIFFNEDSGGDDIGLDDLYFGYK